MALSITAHDNPFTMATVRGTVELLDGEAAWEIIDRISRKYTGEPYPRGEERVVFLVEPAHALAVNFG
ncbi:hypothetical protein [Nonomuraea dietziae]|uniref:hypothetical protein n=1 Tax=Nonomuraea dietziae TaxID=65515 RepID=UPI0031DA48C0